MIGAPQALNHVAQYIAMAYACKEDFTNAKLWLAKISVAKTQEPLSKILTEVKIRWLQSRDPKVILELDKVLQKCNPKKDSLFISKIYFIKAIIAHHENNQPLARQFLHNALEIADGRMNRYDRWRIFLALAYSYKCSGDEHNMNFFYERASHTKPQGLHIQSVLETTSCPKLLAPLL